MSDTLRHIVRQHNWLLAGAVFVRAPGERRIAWFDTADEAAADRLAREHRVRDSHNPFTFGTIFHQLSTFPVVVFHDWLLDEDIEPPAEVTVELPPWREWWDASRERLSATQRHRVWDGLNRLQFHDVIARRPAQTAYCVSRILWSYDDSWYHAGHEGGEPLRVFRHRERAEAECQRLDAELAVNQRERRTDWGHFPRDPEQFLEYERDGDCYHRSIREPAPQYEVVEIDYPGGTP